MKPILSVTCLLFLITLASAQVQQPSVVLDTLHPSNVFGYFIFEDGQGYQLAGRNLDGDLAIESLDANFVSTRQSIRPFSPRFGLTGAILLPGEKIFCTGFETRNYPLEYRGSVVKIERGVVRWRSVSKWDSVWNDSYGSALDSTGHVILAGLLHGPGVRNRAATLSKFTDAGGLEWSKSYTDFDPFPNITSAWRGWDVEVRSDNRYMLFAYTISDSMPFGLALLEVDDSGNMQDTTFLGENGEWALGMSMDQNDNTFLFSHDYFGRGRYRILNVRKLSPQGRLLWEEEVSYKNPQDSILSAALVRGRATNDGGCVLLFRASSLIPSDTTSQLESDIFIAKLGPNGDTQWEIALVDSGGQSPFDIIQLKDGGYVISGAYSRFPDGQFAYFVKLSDDGTTVSTEKFQELPLQVSIGPNPFKDETSVRFQLQQAAPVSVQLTDFTGRQLYQETYPGTPGKNQLNLSVPNLAAGTYLLKLVSSQASWQGKVVKR
ncbi:MAG: T9SS type A sorting domain-containing protein [Bacteroidota bacterium]